MLATGLVTKLQLVAKILDLNILDIQIFRYHYISSTEKKTVMENVIEFGYYFQMSFILHQPEDVRRTFTEKYKMHILQWSLISILLLWFGAQLAFNKGLLTITLL